jgi:hypothetical protein
MEKKHKGKKIFRLLMILFFLFLVGAFLLIREKVSEVRAGETDNVAGWAWSENFGWFSGNCSNLGLCPDDPPPPYNYGLNVNEDGTITGYLWAEHLGWVQFGGLSGMPSPGQALYDNTTGRVTGWAKVLTLGDDGWVKLRGSSVPVGVGPYRECLDCEDVRDAEGTLIDVVCRICFKSELYGGSGNICSNCSGCTRGAENTCNVCTDCDAYGAAIDRETGRIVGWGWNGNVDPAVGVGWLNFSPTMAGLGLMAPWLETQFGEIYGKPYVRSPSAFVEILGKYNATYCIMTTGEITHFTSKEPREEGGCLRTYFESYDFPKTSNIYTNVFGKIDKDGILAGKYGVVQNINDETDIPNLLGGKVYSRNGDLTVTGIGKTFNNAPTPSIQNGAGLIIVKGNLYIQGNTSYQNAPVMNLKNLASVGWMVFGDIIIDPSVENIVGAFYTEGEVRTGTMGDPRMDKPLTVRGLILAYKFKFERLWRSAQRGSEQIIYDGRVLANTPPGMADLIGALPVWREAAP